jgi:hypothetical protein
MISYGDTQQQQLEEKDAADFSTAAKVAGFNKSFYRISMNSLDSGCAATIAQSLRRTVLVLCLWLC